MLWLAVLPRLPKAMLFSFLIIVFICYFARHYSSFADCGVPHRVKKFSLLLYPTACVWILLLGTLIIILWKLFESFLWDLSDQEVQRICFTDIYPYEMSLLCVCVDKFTDFTAPGPAVIVIAWWFFRFFIDSVERQELEESTVEALSLLYHSHTHILHNH